MALFGFFGNKKAAYVSCADFHQLMAKNDLALAAELLENGHDANCIINAGVTPIMTASVYNNAEMVSLLLKHNANIDRQSESGWTALLYAADNGNMEAAKVLTGNGAKTELKLKHGETAFVMAVYKNHIDMARLLADSGASLTVTIYHGINVLMMAANSGYIEMTEFLLEIHAVDINAKNDYGETALMRAVIQGHPEAVQLLLRHGADKSIKDSFNNNALFYTKKFNRPDIAQILDKN